MHFFNFVSLTEDEQLEVLWYNGEQIGSRKIGEYLILLYQVEGFYVEIFYHNKERLIKKYLSFEDVDRLEPYLRDIDLSPVYRYMKKRPKNRAEQVIDLSLFAGGHEPLKKGASDQQSKRKSGLWNIFLSIFQK